MAATLVLVSYQHLATEHSTAAILITVSQAAEDSKAATVVIVLPQSVVTENSIASHTLDTDSQQSQCKLRRNKFSQMNCQHIM